MHLVLFSNGRLMLTKCLLACSYLQFTSLSPLINFNSSFPLCFLPFSFLCISYHHHPYLCVSYHSYPWYAIVTIATIIHGREASSSSSSSLPHLRHHHFSAPLVVFINATSPNLHNHQQYFAWYFIIIIVPPSSLSL